MKEKELYINFDEYIRQGEPQKRERADAWRVAIGLQAVDGLKTSEYLQETARRNIEGEITIDEALFLVRFFRNLLLGEDNLLKNRYMMIDGPEEWKMPESEQAPDKYRTSTGQVQDKLHTDNSNVERLVYVIGEQELSVKEMMNGVGLKGRDNFLNLYLNPAITDGYVRLLYPQSPRHPRQKYLLTVKGMMLFNELNK